MINSKFHKYYLFTYLDNISTLFILLILINFVDIQCLFVEFDLLVIVFGFKDLNVSIKGFNFVILNLCFK